MQKMRRFIGVALLLATMMTMLIPISANAANYSYSGSQSQSGVITITTGSSAAKLTFSQTKGKYTYLWKSGLGTYNTVSTYGCYFVYVQDLTSGSASVYNIYVSGSKTITLAKNRTYRVSICASDRDITFRELDSRGILKWKAFNCNSASSYWSTTTYWSAKVTNAKTSSIVYH